MNGKETLSALAITSAFVLALSACGNGAGQTPDPMESPAETAPMDAAPDAESPTQDEGGEGGDEMTVSGEDEHRVSDEGAIDITCDGGGEIYVEAAAEVTITGDCWDIEITADGATVTADQTRGLDIEGSDNEVTIESVRELDIEGDNNTVETTSVEEVEVEGSTNTVTYTEDVPDIQDDGTDNTIEQG
ncbi:DUF3060 domain-containing protein [Nocardiopsis alkaliphila]|uniref:DUF3060 domain-containing protein n=1 Tax=Nocardiopsis alkaliphila TaxID=225762 RepID=UPI00036CED00|nr:DUF3060 domain-containing protein [Nocardiopsis alkaliphila]